MNDDLLFGNHVKALGACFRLLPHLRSLELKACGMTDEGMGQCALPAASWALVNLAISCRMHCQCSGSSSRKFRTWGLRSSDCSRTTSRLRVATSLRGSSSRLAGEHHAGRRMTLGRFRMRRKESALTRCLAPCKPGMHPRLPAGWPSRWKSSACRTTLLGTKEHTP